MQHFWFLWAVLTSTYRLAGKIYLSLLVIKAPLTPRSPRQIIILK
jgi:hypothetical protein